MILSKPQEADLLRAYNGMWDAYLKGDHVEFGTFLADDYKLIGTTAEEVFFTRTEVLEWLKATASQFAGIAEFRNRKVKVFPLDGVVLVEEAMDLYIKIESEWRLYSALRASSLLKETENGWKFLHTHGSVPDMKVEEGETIAVNKIQKENQELRDAIRRRTKELEEKNRELEIEASLERVRARSLAMFKSDEIQSVVDELFVQLKQLSVNLDAVNILIFEGGSKNFEAWTASGTVQSHRTRFIIPYKSLPVIDALLSGRDNAGKVLNYRFPKHEKDEFFNYLFEASDYRELSTERKNYLLSAACFTVSTVMVGDIAVQANSYSRDRFSEEEIQIIERFALVFSQAYLRFLDLQKAEAQGREAQIEAALEKVRSRSLAMHKSDELQDVIELVFEKLKELQIRMDSAAVMIVKENRNDVEMWVATPGHVYQKSIFLPYFDHPIQSLVRSAREAGHEFFEKVYSFEEKNEWWNNVFQNTAFREIPEERKQFIMQSPGFSQAVAFSKNIEIVATNYVERTLDENEKAILKKFAHALNQAYTRFLDLQRAEIQTRQAQIQLSVERVRSRAMAMHHSDELSDVLSLLFEQFDVLGITPNHVILSLIDFKNGLVDFRLTGKAGKRVSANQVVNLSGTEIWNEMLDRMKNDGPPPLNFIHYPKEVLPQVWETFSEVINAIPVDARIKIEDFPEGMYNTEAYCQFGYLGFCHTRFGTEEEQQILQRFATEFGQLYQRFLDLQKAEAQAREAQIEAALEKVRSRSLGMHKSSELIDVAAALFERLGELGLSFDGAFMFTFDRETRGITLWIMTRAQMYGAFKIDLPHDPEYADNQLINDLWHAVESGEPIISRVYSGKEKNDYFRYVHKHNGQLIPTEVKQLQFERDWTVQLAPEKNSITGFDSWSGHVPSEADFKIVSRFAKVFEQAYVRFVDLQRAEKQTREAQIEAALERVRSRTMAMQKSSELTEVASLLFQQVRSLGIKAWTTGFNVWSDDNNSYVDYVTDPEGNFIDPYTVDTTLSPVFRQVSDARKAGLDFLVQHDQGESIKETYRLLLSFSDKLQFQKLLDSGFQFPTEQFAHFVFGAKASLLFITYEPVPAAHNIFKRFGKVFEQTYTRFLDLQKAEAQAREAQIEASLERVRSRAMAMQTSGDLNALIGHIFSEVTRLGLELDRVLVLIVDPDTLDTNWILANPESPDHHASYQVKYHEHTPYLDFLDAWKNRTEKWRYVLEGEAKKSWDAFIFVETGLARLPDQVKNAMRSLDSIILNASFGNFGNLAFSSVVPLSEEQFDLVIRFAKVLDLTYTRFNDLKRSEARAREAVQQAALDRVRAEIASMRTITDLDRITPLIWRELTTLGVPFVRCGVFIMEEAEEKIHTFLTTPDGRAIAAFRLPYASANNLYAAVEKWRTHQRHVVHWVAKDFEAQASFLAQQGAIPSREQYLNGIPAEGIYLHFVPFLQGMLYVGHTADLDDDHLNVIQSVADAFSTAYARYEDFNKLEAAKQQTDKTLNELRATQSQLVQAEKMASLGELTAGIAHEIQNPLNFVNNFSEVSNELIEEMKAEVIAGNMGQVAALADDVKQNLEKINYHGKRADAIVKSMLQHSRKSTGQKEPTDMNALCDEYLRLAYHGFRAKDKSFNAKYETEFDPTIPKVNAVPQEIGRVILNLVSNAFYAVSEKQKAERNVPQSTYRPAVSISTKNVVDRIEVRVTDNGGGIPEHIKDKIFQPFFTTKPTGQGTGLGLSLSYDIVKAHGGSFHVSSEDGRGSTFCFTIPISMA